LDLHSLLKSGRSAGSTPPLTTTSQPRTGPMACAKAA